MRHPLTTFCASFYRRLRSGFEGIFSPPAAPPRNSRLLPLTPLRLLLYLYLALALTTLLVWTLTKRNTVTGDEPHYLVMASGIVRHATLEQTQPYEEEFRSKEIFPWGMAPPEAKPSQENTHAILGPHGLYNVHNIGLPFIIALPFLLGGVTGAKVFLVLLGGIAIIIAWKISGLFSLESKPRFFVVLATSVALPLIPAANQIYPDVLAGIISLSGIYWLMTTTQHRPWVKELLWAGAIAYLPWLQIKLAATCAVLVVALGWKIHAETKNFGRIARILAVTLVSAVLLGCYNYYAFGKVSGPYQSGALEVSKTAGMVLLGLWIDPNQGFLLQNPIMFVGLFSLGALWFRDRTLALVWALVFLSLLVPNGLHPNWYGGGSFSGRFNWSAAVVFYLPTVFGLLRLADAHGKIFRTLVGSSLLLQIYFFCLYAFININLYNKAPDTWLETYAIYYYPIFSWMPALYNADWALGYAPNYAWLVLALLVLTFGFTRGGNLNVGRTNVLRTTLITGLLIIIVSGFLPKNVREAVKLTGKELPSQSGHLEGTTWVATAGKDQPGFVTYGPYYPLRSGSYQVVMKYSSQAAIDRIIGYWDIYDSYTRKKIGEFPLRGTAGAVKANEVSFEVKTWRPHLFEFRNNWNGVGEIEIHGMELKPN